MFIFLFYDHLVEIECVKSLNSGKHIAYPPGFGGRRKIGEVFRQCDKIATTWALVITWYYFLNKFKWSNLKCLNHLIINGLFQWNTQKH